MKRISYIKIAFTIIAIVVLGLSLSSCTPIIEITGTAKLIVSGDYYYNIKMDDYTYFSAALPGTYYITDITPGYHTFEAVDIGGASWGYDSEAVYISSGSTTNVYLNPTPSVVTGTVYVSIMNDSYEYHVYMDGNSSTGEYLGATDSNGEGIFYNVPTGYHSFYAISDDNLYDGWGNKTIYTGTNYVQIYTY
ncbi:MAG: hypothetical protein WDA32_07060 [Candidatus Caldatribacteriota bacterium]